MKLKEINNLIDYHSFGNSGNQCFIIGGQHGDEVMGVEIAYSLIDHFENNPPLQKIMILPCANKQGLEQNTRELNGKDLNRLFENTQHDADIISENIKEVILESSLVIDLHTTPNEMMGSDEPVLLSKPLNLCNYFQGEIRDKRPPRGSLRWFCETNNIDVLLFEGADDPSTYDTCLDLGIQGILNLLQGEGWI